MRGIVKLIVKEAIERGERVTASQIAARAGVTRQAAQQYLRGLVAAGVVRKVGKGPRTAYEPVTGPAPAPDASRADGIPIGKRFALNGLQEHEVWKELARQFPPLPPDAEEIAYTCFTELLNNAIDHSEGTVADISMTPGPPRFIFTIEDDGIGAFERIRTTFHLPNHLEALQEVSKGKLTSAPERHTGMGLFFASKSANHFSLDANGLTWKVDNDIQDVAVGQSPRTRGTLVSVEVAHATTTRMKEIYDRYSTGYDFTDTHIHVRLFETGLRFVSRSEAKRVAEGLEKFRRAIIDFAGVDAIGQGFADELFRVWASRFPQTTLEPINMNPVIRQVVEEAVAPR